MWSIKAYMRTSCIVQILKFGSTAAGLAFVSWNNAIKALFIRDLCAALDRTHTMTPITTRRTATAVAPMNNSYDSNIRDDVLSGCGCSLNCPPEAIQDRPEL